MLATQDADALLDLDADCICYTANSDLRPDGVIDDIVRMLASGKNVVNTSYVPLLFPPAAGEGVAEKLQAACLEGGTSLYTSGIDPGFGNAGLAIHALALCKEVRKVRMMEIVNYDTWDNPFTMFQIMGFGKQDPSRVAAPVAGVDLAGVGPGAAPGRVGHRPRARRRAGDATRSSAPTRTSRSRPGPIEKGTISGMRFEIIGLVGGEERIVVEHVTRLRDDDAPDWPQGAVLPDPHRGRAPPEARARARLRRRRPQPRRLPGHRHARGERHPPRGGGRARHPHHARPAGVLSHDLAGRGCCHPEPRDWRATTLGSAEGRSWG